MAKHIKNLIIIFIILVVITCIAVMHYRNLEKEKYQITQFNLQFEKYNSENTNGLDVTTLINSAINNNEKNYVEKDNDGYFDLNDENSIEIYVTMIINGKTYRMEQLEKQGIDKFTEYFGEIQFKCTNISYHENGKIASMIFEAQSY